MELFERTGTRFSEFVRLPYFNGPRMTVIDPMHCCFLGESLFISVHVPSLRARALRIEETELKKLVAPSRTTHNLNSRHRQDSVAACMELSPSPIAEAVFDHKPP